MIQVANIDTLPLRGTKRKVISLKSKSAKRARRTPPPEEHLDQRDHFLGEERDINGLDSSQTFPSPISGKPSPRFPSQLKTIPCTYPGCEKTFNRPARLQEHLRSHTDERIFACPHDGCGKDFLRQSHLNHHVKSAHSLVREYVCNYEGCGKSFVTNTRLKRHHVAHEGREKHMCHDCGQSFRKHATLNRHILTVHEGKSAFVCEEIKEDGTVCGMGFDTAGKLRTHCGREHGSEQYHCTICQEENEDVEVPRFATYTDLQNHNKTIHPPTCPECRLPCDTARELRRHIESEHGIEDPDAPPKEATKHLCTEEGCGKVFSRKGNLAVHLRTVHGGAKAFVCGQVHIANLNNVFGWTGTGACARAFTAKASLEEHIRTAHLGLEHSRKAEREAKKGADTKARSKVTTLDLLCGDSYSRDPSRKIPCLIHGCNFLYTRVYDRDNHLRTGHGLGDLEVHRLRVASDTWDQEIKVEASDGEDWEQQPELFLQPMFSEDQFWVGGQEPDFEEDREGDLEQMRELIDGDDEDDDMDGMAIDPALC